MKLISFIFSREYFVPILGTVAFVLVTLFIFSKWRRHVNSERLKRQYGCEDPPKYPHTDWVLGSDLAQLRESAIAEGYLFPLYLSHFEKYGKTFEENWKGLRMINTMDPINIQHIATVALDDYCKDPVREAAQGPFLGLSVFSDSPHWKSLRALIVPIFNKAELSDIDNLALFTDRFMDLIPTDGSTFDILPLLIKLFLDVSTDSIFGKCVGCLEPETPRECAEFLEALHQTQKGIIKRWDSPWNRFILRSNKDWIRAYTTVHNFIDRQVQRALERTKLDGKTGTTERKRYILLDEMSKWTRDPIELRNQVLSVFLPARESTARAVGNTIFELARHPEIWKKLRGISMELGDRPITLDLIKSLTDFRNVVLESIRLIGPSARVNRTAARDTVLPTGGGFNGKSPIFVPKGTRMVIGNWCVHHDKDLWGGDWDQFIPDRWSGRQTRWEFVPFLGGPRRCPAQQQVMTHAIYMLVRLTQRFENIENRDSVLEYVEKHTMGHTNKTGVQISFS